MSEMQTYLAPDAARWRVEDAAALLADYDLAPAGLPDWHRVMAGAGEQVWQCLCRRYAVFAILTTTDLDRMRPAGDGEIAKALGLKAEHVADLLKQALGYWQKQRRRDAGAGTGILPLAEAARPAMEEAEIERLLALYGFGNGKPEERKAIARRCQELSSFLDNDLLRSTAVSLIQQELHLAAVDAAITAEKNKDAPSGKELRESLATRSGLQEKIEKTQERLGIWNTPDAMKKRADFSDGLATVVTGIQQYYADGSRELIDNVNTEGEIEVQLRDFDLRKPQYRGDLPLLTVPASIEGLWDPLFKAPALPRHVHRRLAKAFKAALASARQEDGTDIEELDQEPEPVSEDD